MAKVVELSANIQVFGALSRLLNKGDVFEIRIPKTAKEGTVSGYFDDIGIATKMVMAYSGKVPGVYVTLNPVNKDILARAANRMVPRSMVTTTDREIEKRRWLPIDFDPVRPAGISSTNEEHEYAQHKAAEVMQWLAERGWPAPVQADSGNGAHLLYPIDIPNDAEGERIVKGIIHFLSATFSDEHVSVDGAVYNASRIWKIYGTKSCKGDDTSERPHRQAKMLDSGDTGPVSIEQLKDMAALWEASSGAGLRSETGSAVADMENWLHRLDVKIANGPHDLFGGKGKKWVLAECPFNESHNSPIVGIVEGKPIFRCLHNSCQGHNWAEFRAKIDPNFVAPDVLARDIVKAYKEDSNLIFDDVYINGAAQLSVTKLDSLGKTLRASGISGNDHREFMLRTKDARAKLLAKDYGTKGVPHNLHGLAAVIEEMQATGEAPVMWMNSLTGQLHTGGVDEDERIDIEEASIDLMMKFHGLGHKWVKKGSVMDALAYLASKNKANPIESKFKGLIWDRIPRIDKWLTTYLGTEDTEYNTAIGRKWLISAVARGLRPGCQADHMLILEGTQGIGKSQALRVLGGHYHVEYGGSIGGPTSENKDMVAIMAGKSIIEISELHSFRRSSIEGLRNFLTVTADDVRLAYRRDSRRIPRTVVFAGTTNDVRKQYIEDVTGARRFWPTVCGKIDIPALKDDVDQLWAEAAHYFEEGEDWWDIPAEILKPEQDERKIDDEDDLMTAKLVTELTDIENLSGGFTVLIENMNSSRKVTSYSLGIASIEHALKVWLDLGPLTPNWVQRSAYNALRRIGFEKRKSKQLRNVSKGWIWNPRACEAAFAYPRLEEFIQAIVEKSHKEWTNEDGSYLD